MTATFKDFEALRPQLRGLAGALLRNTSVRLDPEDLVQSVLTEIYAKLQAGAEIRNPGAYANCALKNRAVDEIRRHYTKYETPWPTLPDGDQVWEPPDLHGGQAELDPVLRDVLGKLEPGERCFIWRVVFEQRAVHDAQSRCGWPDKSPYFFLKRVFDKLRPMLGVERGR